MSKTMTYEKYKRGKKVKKIAIVSIQILLLVAIIFTWEMLARFNIIDTFIITCLMFF